MNRHKQAPPCISTANSSTLVLDDTPPYEQFERDTKRMNLNNTGSDLRYREWMI